ncbi:MAG: hypothetical protein ACP5G1_00415 [Nanopusillaceae archaeon]
MEKRKAFGLVIGLLFIAGFLAPYFYSISRGNSNINQSELYKISQVSGYCQSICYYAKYNLSINLTEGCLTSPQSIFYNDWQSYLNYYIGDLDWGCQISKENKNLCGNVNSLIILNENCSVKNIIYKNQLLNITQ